MAARTTKSRAKKYPKLPRGATSASEIIRDLKITPAELRRAQELMDRVDAEYRRKRSAAK